MRGNVYFMRIPPTLRLTTDALEAGLERRRQAVLRDPWRPARGELVPWQVPTDKLDAMIRDGMRQVECIEQFLGVNVVPIRR